MQTFLSPRRLVRLGTASLLSLLTVVLLAGCGSSAAGASTSGKATSLAHLTVGLTYVPDIQFAPFYVAEQQGYYKAAGLDVTLQHQVSASAGEFDAITAGREDAVFAGGDEMLGARAHNVPLVYVANVYRQYPTALIVPASSSIHSPADLRGKTIGIPGAYGELYYGLLALLKAGHLSLSDVHVESIGYTQIPQLLAHKVDAAMGYVNNEPIQLAKAGMQTRTLTVSTTQPLVSDGLVATDKLIQQHPDEVRALVSATLKGVQYTIAHPNQAVTISKHYVPSLNDAGKSADALAVLKATIPLWQSNGAQIGYTSPQQWSAMAQFLEANKQLPSSVDASAALNNSFLPAK